MAGPGDNQRTRKQQQAESEAFKRSITAIRVASPRA